MLRTIIIIVSTTLLLLTACGQSSDASNGAGVAPTHRASTQAQAQASAAGTTIQPVIATSELVVGPNRMALGILDNNVPIKDAAQTKVKLRYYRLKGEQGTLVGEEDTRFYGENLGERGTFIAHPAFDTAGNWGLEVVVQRPNQQSLTFRQTVEVKEKANAPKIGDPAPRSKTPTVKAGSHENDPACSACMLRAARNYAGISSAVTHRSAAGSSAGITRVSSWRL